MDRMEFFGQPWHIVLLFVVILVILISIFKFVGSERIIRYTREHRFELIIAIAVVFALICVLTFSAFYIDGKQWIFPPPDSIILSTFGVMLTVFGVLISLKILSSVSSEIHDFPHLLKMIKDDLAEYNKDRSDIKKMNPKPFLYIYAATPSLGNVSSRTTYDDFNGRINGLIEAGLVVKAICRPLSEFENFHKKVSTTKNGDGDADIWTKEAMCFTKKIVERNDENHAVLTIPIIFNVFLVITPKAVYEFMIQRADKKGHHQLTGRAIRHSSDIKFFRESFEQFWQDQIDMGREPVKIKQGKFIDKQGDSNGNIDIPQTC